LLEIKIENRIISANIPGQDSSLQDNYEQGSYQKRWKTFLLEEQPSLAVQQGVHSASNQYCE